MITRINKSKALTKHKSYDCKCKHDGRKSTIIQRKPQIKWIIIVLSTVLYQLPYCY